MSSKCNNGKRPCKYLGDLPDICPDYCKGEHSGDPIIAWNEFPKHCQECKDREFNWCKRHHDLICFAEQDPYACRLDLTKDTLEGAELIQFRIEALKKACEKWGSPLTNRQKERTET
jgi:hypothetical protein